MRSSALRTVLLAVPGVLLVSCTSSGGTTTPAPSTTTRTVIGTRTVTGTASRPAPVSSGPTTTSAAARCPLLDTPQAAARVGMRLARITVQRSGGRIVGCRFYALQGSPLAHSEQLPGPKQPAIEIETTRYPSALAAHNAFVLAARKGTNPQQATIGLDNLGVCFQIAFYRPDHGRDWACAFSTGTRAVVIRTVALASLDALRASRAVAAKL
jgi:hypothetical protein